MIVKYRLTSHDRAISYQKRKLKQVLHDERCRPILEGLAKAKGGKSIAVALAHLEDAKIPAPGGGKWHRRAVYRIAARLGIDLLSGRAFGEFPRCARCNTQMGRVYPDDFCMSCFRAKMKRKQYGSLHRFELESARERLDYYQEKVKALESGSRHWSREHPRPPHRFGKPTKPRNG